LGKQLLFVLLPIFEHLSNPEHIGARKVLISQSFWVEVMFSKIMELALPQSESLSIDYLAAPLDKWK
jgi:hypothetical protein